MRERFRSKYKVKVDPTQKSGLERIYRVCAMGWLTFEPTAAACCRGKAYYDTQSCLRNRSKRPYSHIPLEGFELLVYQTLKRDGNGDVCRITHDASLPHFMAVVIPIIAMTNSPPGSLRAPARTCGHEGELLEQTSNDFQNALDFCFFHRPGTFFDTLHIYTCTQREAKYNVIPSSRCQCQLSFEYCRNHHKVGRMS
jgi:hypothetical protein